jgi:hypothetical protein
MRTEVLQESRDVSDNTLTHELSFEEVRDSPPDGGYGWVCVACCFTINAFTWGVLSVSPLLFHPLLHRPQTNIPVLWRLPLILPAKQRLPLRKHHRLRPNRRSQLLHGNDNLPPRHLPNPHLRRPRPHGPRHPQPNIRLHRRLFRLANLAALPHPRLTRRLRYRPHLDPQHRCPTTMVPEEKEYGKRHLFRRFRNRRDNLLVRRSRNHVQLLTCLGAANVRLGERLHEYPRYLRDSKQESHRATKATSLRCATFQTL